uniref:Thioesterase domain-containing protein n=1 Tax=Neobodo designis TaxID=312471 RepID=A0A7S1LE87_NEODS|mmetsp:Transcript_20397/g.63391  ORF Transcript_20397/g.63391 Transcript_20397/m.63391 type:complete len:234 (+) Transcript_20397:125-826(+)|eukprot:CAMPEP_0174850880 /NCGR_PEP_ID=MMETSP1114-20130205/21189_1 /TAXON_ID=312471 /ORGANISM="Neobodo designis, Strain CCAP 1951/1" /LENGTH=233 /DNA_ID=CAMNT_0016085371 /DNA_START=125 /DNA_END=826 /DNA_ORIENTATION=+
MAILHTLRTAYYFLHGALVAPHIRSILEPAVTRVYVGYRAMDLFMHVNNARYLEYFEFARWHHGARANINARFWDTGVYPVVGTAHVQFLKELKPGRFAFVSTQVVGVHKRSLVLEQRLVTHKPKTQEEVLHATMVMRATFLRKGKALEIADVIKAYDLDPDYFRKAIPFHGVEPPAPTGKGLGGTDPTVAPAMPPFIAQYNECDDAWRARLKEERERGMPALGVNLDDMPKE